MKINFTVVGGDARSDCLARLLELDGHGAERVKGEDLKRSLALKNAVILPYPCLKDGKLSGTDCPIESFLSSLGKAEVIFGGSMPRSVIDFARSSNIKIIDYAKREELLLANAALTAEAALAMVLGSSDRSIRGQNVVICGYGRIGEALSNLLSSFGSKVSVAARSYSSRLKCEMRGFDAFDFSDLACHMAKANLVFNTVPSLVIDKSVLAAAAKDCLIIDLASAPGGVDFACAEKLGIKAQPALGLPGKYAPMSAAEIIKKAIYNSIEEEGLFS